MSPERQEQLSNEFQFQRNTLKELWLSNQRANNILENEGADGAVINNQEFSSKNDAITSKKYNEDDMNLTDLSLVKPVQYWEPDPDKVIKAIHNKQITKDELEGFIDRWIIVLDRKPKIKKGKKGKKVSYYFKRNNNVNGRTLWSAMAMVKDGRLTTSQLMKQLRKHKLDSKNRLVLRDGEQGRRKGRRKLKFDRKRFIELRDRGLTRKQIAKEFGISLRTLERRLSER